MNDDLIQLPKIEEIKEMLEVAKRDVKTEVEQDPELKPASELLIQVMAIVDAKLSKTKDFENLNAGERIDIAAHLNFLQALLEDFFMFDEDFEDFEEDEDDEEDFEEEEEDDSK